MAAGLECAVVVEDHLSGLNVGAAQVEHAVLGAGAEFERSARQRCQAGVGVAAVEGEFAGALFY